MRFRDLAVGSRKVDPAPADQASKMLAAEVIQKQPAALQLRYLQTLVEIGKEKNTTVVFPLPIDIIASLGEALDRSATDGEPGPSS